MSEQMFGAYPSDRLNPSFDLEGEAVAEELKPTVMAPPAYASPDPATAGAPLVPVEDSPHTLSPDYGEGVVDAHEAVVSTDHFEGTLTPAESLRQQGKAKAADNPDNRNDWTRAHWQAQARAYDLPVGGTKAELQERVTAFEGELEADEKMTAEEWKDEIEGAESADDLAAIRERYGATGKDYSTVEAAFEKAEADLNDES